MAPGDPVDRVGIVRYLDAALGQLLTKSYRPRPSDRRGLRQRHDSFGQLLGPIYGRLPDSLARGRVERGEYLAAPTVQHGAPFSRGAGLAHRGGDGIERADAAGRQAEADAEPTGRRDPHPQAGEGARAEPARQQVHVLPAAGRGNGPLDLLEQAGRVPGPSLRGKPQLRLVQYLAVAPGAGDGVYRRGVETDDDQGVATPSPGRPKSRLSCL